MRAIPAKSLLVILLVLGLGACSNSSAPAVSTSTPVTVIPTVLLTPTRIVPPTATITPTFVSLSLLPTRMVGGEILRTSGSGPKTNIPLTLKVDTVLRINWQQSSKGRFVLTVNNLDTSKINTPYGKVTFADIVGPSSGSGDYPFIAGSYVVSVEQADGPWQVWIQVLSLGTPTP